MILAITGATGFVGQAVVDEALRAGHTVRAIARRPQVPRADLEWVPGDLANAAALRDLCAGADAVLHIAGAVNVPSRDAFAAANIAGTQNLLDAARRAGVHRLVHVSSLAAREPGLSDYGWSKAGAEDAVRGSLLDWTIVRPPGVYGPRDRDMLDLFRMARRGFLLLPPAGRGSWIHVEDLGRLLVTLADGRARQTVLEPDDGAPLTHRDLGRRIADAVGRPRALLLAAPRPLLLAAGRADRLLRGSRAKLTPDRARYMAHPDWTADPALSVPRALWTPRIATADGLPATAAWYRTAGWLG